MKKTFLYLTVIFAALILNACGPSTDDAIKYNDSIVDIENNVDQAIDNFFTATEAEGSDMEAELNKVISIADSGMAKIKEVKDFKDGADFKSSAVELMGFYQSLLTNDFKQMAKVLADTNATEADFKKVQDQLEASKTKGEAIEKKFEDAQKAFAEKYNFKIAPASN